MADSFRMCMAELTFDVHPLFAEVQRLCTDYAVESNSQPASLVLKITQADIEAEREMATPEQEWSDAYLETLAVYRRIAEWLPAHRRMLMHGAAIEFGGNAFMFAAASGMGKSTHIRLWHQYLGDAVQVINGDKPIVRVPAEMDALPVVYGTPWAGKEGWQRNAQAPLAGLCFLERAEPGCCTIRRLEPAEALERIVNQTYLPATPEAVANTLDLLDAMLARVPLYLLSADMSADAVRISFEALTGAAFDDYAEAK